MSSTSAPSSVLAPFRSRDFTLLYLINLCEFLATTLSRLSALQQLYELTGDGRALGGLGVVTLLCQIPSIAMGGVLADTVHRATLVSRVQAVACCIASLRAILCAAGALTPPMIYITVGLLEITSRLESSARSSITATVVPKHALSNAVTITQFTQFAGELVAPFLFWALADAGGAALTPSFAMAALSFLPCAILPRLIRADTQPVGGDATSAATTTTTSSSSSSSTSAFSSGGLYAAWVGGLKRMLEVVPSGAG